MIIIIRMIGPLGIMVVYTTRIYKGSEVRPCIRMAEVHLKMSGYAHLFLFLVIII